MKCKDRMHEIVENEVEKGETQWKEVMTKSFSQMDNEVVHYSSGAVGGSSSNCRCELQTPQCDAVGSTAVVAVVTSEKIIVSNCGDSRAVLCRNGVAIPLSIDHKVRHRFNTSHKFIKFDFTLLILLGRPLITMLCFYCSRIDQMN